MKKLLFVTGLLTTIAVTNLLAQLSPVRQKAITLKRVIEQKHISPRPINDSFSKDVFFKLIDQADPRRLYLLATEYQQLYAFVFKLDDELQGKGWEFMDLFTRLFRTALLRADSITSPIFKKPLNFTVAETITAVRTRSYNFSADLKALESRWTRFMKLKTLEAAYDRFSADSAATDFPALLTKWEPGIREKIQKSEARLFKHLLHHPSGFNSAVADIYLNAIAASFDPHTNYFSPEGRDEFKNSLSTETYSFGLEIQENEKRQIVISRLIPGGPAWKSGALHKGDELIELKWDDQPTLNVDALSVEEIYDLLELGGPERKLTLKVRKADNAIRELGLRKATMDNEENIVKSFILKGEKKIGYIMLPGFYTEWENGSGSSCANDVAREIIKLNSEKIEGLILDIRFNGGGSVEEALEMTGIFIDEGPLGGERRGDLKVRFFKDPNRGTAYDGPLAILVNGQSASASEIVAASVQDYNRGVIIGSSTFGKATMQQLFPVDSNARGTAGSNTEDVVKITFGKLYRLTGMTAQQKGILPDIELPDAFAASGLRESTLPNSLSPDTVTGNTYFKRLSSLPIASLVNASKERTAKNQFFTEIRSMIRLLTDQNAIASTTIPLKADLFAKWAESRNSVAINFDTDINEPVTSFVVDNHTSDRQLLADNEDATEVNKTWISHVKADRYIEEAFFVLRDLINLQRNPGKN